MRIAKAGWLKPCLVLQHRVHEDSQGRMAEALLGPVLLAKQNDVMSCSDLVAIS